MQFSLTEEQRMLRDTVSRYLADASELDIVRKSAEAHATHDPAIWSGLCELGVAGVIVPEEHGGLGLGFAELGLIAETIGRHVSPVPFVGSCVMAPVALMEAGSETQQAEWLPRIASGDVIAGVAVAEQIGAREGAGVDAKDGTLSGKALFVIDGPAADILIVADRSGALHLVKTDAPGVTRTALTTIDLTRPVCEVQFDGAPAEALANSSQEALTRIIDAGRVMIAADTLGAGLQMIDKAVDYAKERKQFGRVIGSFQAVKHLCAEMIAELEPCRALVWAAASVLDSRDEEASLLACHAKAHLSEVGRFVARTATEVHGGMGFTDLMGLHYWFKRIGLDRQLLGGPERVRHEAAVLQGWAA